MSNISYAFRAFFSILFSGALSPDIALAFGYTKFVPVKSAKPEAAKPAPPPAPPPDDGGVKLLAALQRDARLVDFLMEDLTGFADEQIGAAVREVQEKSKESLAREIRLEPVIDGVEGDYTKTASLPKASFKLVGNVPPSGKAEGGLLRHKGWKSAQGLLAPAEIEIE